MSQIQLKEKRKLGRFALPLLLLFIVTSIVTWVIYPFPSDIKSAYFDSEHPILINDDVTTYEAKMAEESIYVPIEFVQEEIDEHLFFDENTGSVIVTTKEKVFQLQTDHLTYFVNNQEHSLSFPALVDNNDQKYIATSWMEEVYPIEISYLSETGAVHVIDEGKSVMTGKSVSEYDVDLF